jgi:hypothetical protein
LIDYTIIILGGGNTYETFQKMLCSYPVVSDFCVATCSAFKAGCAGENENKSQQV